MPTPKLGELLVAEGLVSSAQIQEASKKDAAHADRLAMSLVRLGHVNDRVLATFFSKLYGITAISLDGVTVPPELSSLLPRAVCEKHSAIPLLMEGPRLAIAIFDPSDASGLDEIRSYVKKEINPYIATATAIQELIAKTYGGAPPQRPLTPKAPPPPISAPPMTSRETEILPEVTMAGALDSSAKPVVRVVNKIFAEALQRKASDIHIEPFDGQTRVRLRIDGTLSELMELPNDLRASVPARIKVMANLDISEKRLPQDGRLELRTQTRKIDVRISTLPTLHGEKIVMRLLDQSAMKLDLSLMGFEPEQLELYRKAVSQPYGMILVTGPTGSGKSTTLYATLTELNQPSVNISTVEDPIEYHVVGINQVQTKEEIGLTFAAALRSLLRQDPDIILVGEIRDHETAEIAVKAALTGHMVFSTLHTNDAPSAVSRLVHMGMERFLIAASVVIIVAQRLVRSICPHCKVPDSSVTRESLKAAECSDQLIAMARPMRGQGCEHCAQTGYQGRQGIYELMPVTESLRAQIVKGGNADDIRKAAIQAGMISLRQCALRKCARGETTLEEVLQCSRSDKGLF